MVDPIMVFVSIMVLISNSSLTEIRGTVNGYGQALCAVYCSPAGTCGRGSSLCLE